MSLSDVARLVSTGKDFDLLIRLQRREAEALGDVFDLYGPLVYALLYRMTGSAATAEDLLAETLLEVWNRCGSLPADHYALGLWIFSLARNRGIRSLRTAKARVLSRSEEGITSAFSVRLFARFPGADDLIARLQKMRQKWGDLGEDDRSPVIATFFRGASLAEIASQSGQPVHSVEEITKKSLGAVLD
jgi:RNA polymerase sigma-70 factor, ECF subfamily